MNTQRNTWWNKTFLLEVGEFYLPHFLFMLLAFFLPLTKAMISISVTSLFILSFLQLRHRSLWTLRKQDYPLYGLILIFFLFLLSLLYTRSENLSEGIRFVNREFAFLAIPVVLIFQRKLVKKYANLYLWALVAGTSLAAATTLILYALPEDQVIALSEQIGMFREYPLRKNRVQFGLYSPFADRLQFGNLLALSVLIVVFLFGKIQNQARKWAAIGICALLLITLLLIGARGAQLGMMAGALVLVIYYYEKGLGKVLREKWGNGPARLVLITGVVVLFGILPYLAYKNVEAVSKRWNQMKWEIEMYQTGEYLEYDYLYFSALRRWLSWKHSWTLIGEKPLFGTGLGDYEKDMQEIYDRQGLGFPVNSHNQFLFFWASTGLLCLLAFFFCCISWIYWPWRHKKENDTTFFVLSIFFCWLVIMNLDAALIHQINNVAFIFLLGLSLHVTRKEKIPSTYYLLFPRH